jgi:tyrosyl-tRNA synthetase
MTLSEELVWRGFVQDSTFKDLSELDQKKLTFYHGFDASADSQTIGNLAALMLDRLFLKHGHNGILLAGGATSLVGDPGGKEGKDTERTLQSEKAIAYNVSVAETQIKRILSGHKFRLVNNYEWTKDIKLLPFLRDIGKHFSMTPLVQRDYIAQRIGTGGSGISYAEFSYTLLQGLDYLHLYDEYGCTLQIGGSDQWGNCLSGVELIRKLRGAEVQAVTLPLVIDASTGKKFGKSEAGAVWLDENKTSVYKFYQFWLNVSDESVEGYLKVFTGLDKYTLDGLMDRFNTNRGIREAQKVLAYEVTKLVHGSKRADEIIKVTEVLFGKGNFLDLGKNEMNILHHELPVVSASNDLSEVIVTAGLATSKTEAKKFLDAGAIAINGQKAGPDNLELFVKGNNLMKRGKNSFAVIQK